MRKINMDCGNWLNDGSEQGYCSAFGCTCDESCESANDIQIKKVY